MNAIRRDMAEHPDDFLKMVRRAEKKSGIPLSGKAYVRKRPCPEERLEPYYQLRNMVAIREEPISDALFSPELAATVRKSLEGLYPLCKYCQKFVELP